MDYKEQRISEFKALNQKCKKGQIVFAGSSLMEQFPIEKFIAESGENVVVYNRGIGGIVSLDLYSSINECILDLEPSVLFINIGTNDLSADKPISDMIEVYDSIISEVESKLPDIKIYFMAYYPGNFDVAIDRLKPTLKIRNNEKIKLANMEVEKLAGKHNQKYIDVNDCLKDEFGNLKAEFTVEGMHITEAGYRAVYSELLKYIKKSESECKKI